MEELTDVLDSDKLKELEQQNKILYLRYFPEMFQLKLDKEDLKIAVNGETHALVENDLYSRESMNPLEYVLSERNFLNQADIPSYFIEAVKDSQVRAQ